MVPCMNWALDESPSFKDSDRLERQQGAYFVGYIFCRFSDAAAEKELSGAGKESSSMHQISTSRAHVSCCLCNNMVAVEPLVPLFSQINRLYFPVKARSGESLFVA